MENYFNYFTEVEEHFQRRRGTTLLLSTLDWALIETWKDAGIPLEAVLRGIDTTFESYERRARKAQRRVNGLAYCSQEVLAAAEDMREAAVGVASPRSRARAAFDPDEIAAYLTRSAAQVEHAKLPEGARLLASETARSLRDLASGSSAAQKLENLERRLTVMEEKLFAVLLAGTPDEDLVDLRAKADREIARYRSKMPGTQIEQLHKQYVQKVLLERHGLPRLSLFYM